MILPVLVFDGEGVVVQSSAGERVLAGPLLARLVPLLTRNLATEDLVEAMREWDAAEVLFALMRLEAEGCVADAPGSATLAPVPRLELAQLDGVPIVRVDSYLHPALDAVNARALRDGRPWLLARDTGPDLWVGPLIRPRVTACWRCLEDRLRRNLPFEHHLHAHPEAVRRVAPASGGVTVPVALSEAMLRGLENTLLVIDPVTGARRSESVTRRPQCPACGDATRYTTHADRPIVMAPAPKRFTSDGGFRIAAPDETVARFSRLTSPLLGVIRDAKASGDAVLTSSAHYGADPVRAVPPLLGSGLRLASGKGMTAGQALASGLGEAIERYSCVFQGDEPRVTATFAELGAAAIHPNDCMQFSDAQYQARDIRNRESTRYQWIPRPLDAREPLEWTPVWSLVTRERRLLPTLLLYAGYPAGAGDACGSFDPNGNAAGNSIEEAILQGMLELVERDSLAIWWYNRIPRPGVSLPASGVGYGLDLEARYRELGRELWVLDITTDLGIPSYAAVSRRAGEGPEALLLGFGAHLDARIAFTRALTEMNQILGHVTDAEAAGKTMETALTRWLKSATLATQPWLVPGNQIGLPAPEEAAPDLGDDIAACTARFAKSGVAAYVLDQTRPDIGVPVVKVVAPGLRHFRARLAPGRLYDVPVSMGWLDEARPESAMNPIAFFF